MPKSRPRRQHQAMALKHIETSFDPLNLVFKAKTITAFFGWLLLTILSILALIGAIVFLVLKYERMETIAVVELKPTTGPFPAVTLCNMNPYKSSAVASSMPDLQYLIDAHEKAMSNRPRTASTERSTTSGNTADSNGQTPSFDQEDAKSTKAETGSRKKRAPDDVCDPFQTGSEKFQMPNSTDEFTYFPNIQKTWESAFKCCQRKKGRKMARIQGDDAYEFLRANGFLLKKIWFPIQCGDQCYDVSDASPKRLVDWDQLCSSSNCQLTFAGKYDLGFVTIGLAECNITLTKELATNTTAGVICQEESPKTKVGTPVRSVSAKKNTNACPTNTPSTPVPTTTTALASNHSDNSTINTNNTTADPCSCNFDGARTVQNASISPNTFVLYPQTNTSWSCAFKCCQRKPGFKIARVQGDEAFQFLNASGFLQTKIWIPFICYSKKCIWQSNITTNSVQETRLQDICASSTCAMAATPNNHNTLGGYALSASLGTESNVIMLVKEAMENTAAVLCQEDVKPGSPASASVVSSHSISPVQNPTTRKKSESQAVMNTSSNVALSSTSSSSVANTTSVPGFDTNSDPWKEETNDTESLLSSTSSVQSTATAPENDILDPIAMSPMDIVLENGTADEPNYPPSDLKTSPAESSATRNPSLIIPLAQPTFKEAVDKILSDPEITSDQQAVTSTTQDLVPYVVSSESPSNLERMGYTSSEIIFRCTYNGRQCSHEYGISFGSHVSRPTVASADRNWRPVFRNFTLQTDPSYGNCYTFNSDGRNPVSNRPGQGGGLTVAYRVDQSDYLSFIPTYGLKVVLHAQRDPVFPDSNGLSASSGRYTSIVLKQVSIKQMIIGNKACLQNKQQTPFFFYNETNYATEACIKSCQQASIISACFCGDPRLLLPPGATYASCNVTARACVNAWYKDNGDVKCDCPQACENEIYELTSTAALLIGSVSEKNLALIEIYFGSLTTVKYVEQMKYQLFDLLWDISSAIGLFSGMSVLSVFELIQICKGGQMTSSNDDDEGDDE